MDRRQFLLTCALTTIGLSISSAATSHSTTPIVKPPRLRAGDRVGIISPAGATFDRDELNIVIDAVRALGLVPEVGKHALDRYGYLGGTDKNRADDLNNCFADPGIALILPIRGGWGCARLLPYLNYDVIRDNPKIISGFSDITALLLAIHAKTGLVTFHGPNGFSSWRAPQVETFRKVLYKGEKLTFSNTPDPDDANRLMRVKNRIQTIKEGRARGRLIGGNLTLIATLLGSGYLPDFTGAILFVEDIGEDVYTIDRFLTSLKLAGILDKISGFIFGQCTNCTANSNYGSFTLEEAIRGHIQPLNIPSWIGALIGHLEIIETLAIGIEVEIDSRAGTIVMLESAVT